MKDKKDIYTFGQCVICKKDTALKNGYCKDCQDKRVEVPDVVSKIFEGVFKEN